VAKECRDLGGCVLMGVPTNFDRFSGAADTALKAAYSGYVPRVETAFRHAAAVHDAAAALHESAAELFDNLEKVDWAARERAHARFDREGAAADRERARLRREWLERDRSGPSMRHDGPASLATPS
jgi:hypothetical protein